MDDGFKFQVSYKVGDNAQDMVNVRANSPEEFQHNVRALNGLAHDVYLAGETLRAGGMGNQPVGAGVGAQAHPVSPQVQQSAPGWTQPVPAQSASVNCVHGPMQFNQGVSKNGKPYKGHFCNGPEGQKCTPIWV